MFHSVSDGVLRNGEQDTAVHDENDNGPEIEAEQGEEGESEIEGDGTPVFWGLGDACTAPYKKCH